MSRFDAHLVHSANATSFWLFISGSLFFGLLVLGLYFEIIGLIVLRTYLVQQTSATSLHLCVGFIDFHMFW